jgi:uncharacterized protein YcnI
MRNYVSIVVAGAIGCVIATTAVAHVGLTVTGAGAPGSTNLFGFGPGHGCGTSPTIAIRIQIPDGIESVKPVAKPDWTIDIVTDADGEVTEIHFTGGNLPNEWYDQFRIRAAINEEVAPGTPIYFPLVQECVEGAHYWINLPGPGGAEPEGDPAPGFDVREAAEGAAGH